MDNRGNVASVCYKWKGHPGVVLQDTMKGTQIVDRFVTMVRERLH